MDSSRRAFLGMLSAVGGVGVAGCNTVDLGGDEPTPSPVTSPWPMFRHDPQNTAATDAPGPTAPVTEQWRVQPTGEHGFIGATSLTVVGTTVYVGVEDPSHEGSQMFALSIADGSTQWRYDFDEHDSVDIPAPAVVDDTVYAASGEGYVAALAVAENDKQWDVGLDDAFPWVRVRAQNEYWGRRLGGARKQPPTVADDTIYISSADVDSSGLIALDAADGTEQWHFSPDDTDRYTAVAVADDTVYVGAHTYTADEGYGPDNRVYALATSDGIEQWHYEFAPGVAPRTVAVANDTVYVNTMADQELNTLYALAAADGTEQWTVQSVGTAPAVTDDIVYVTGVGDIYALDAADGSERWRHTIGPPRSPAVAGETVYVGGGGSIYALDAADGTERWTVQNGYHDWSSPAVVDGTVYAISNDSSDKFATSVYAITEA